MVTDINEMVPEFTSNVYLSTVISTTPIGTSLLQVVANDGDGGDNIISYAITDQDATTDFNFTVDSSGVIRNRNRFPNVAEGEPEVT